MRAGRAPNAAGLKGRMLMLEEFKKFAMRGNVVDLAVGVIIGRRSAQSSIRWLPTSSCR